MATVASEEKPWWVIYDPRGSQSIKEKQIWPERAEYAI